MKWILAIGMALTTFGVFWVPPAADFMSPDLARIVLVHLPCAIATPLFIIWTAYTSFMYLRTRQWHWEHRALAAAEMALALSCATMATGIMFSRVQWNAWWHWDPRQTSFLVVLLLLGAGFALRSAFDDPVARAKSCAAYAVVSILPLLFLIFVFPNLPQVAQSSLHPQGVVLKMKFTPDYRIVWITGFFLLMATCSWLYRMYVRAALAADALKDIYGKLETDSGGSAGDRVVRPVSVR